MAGGTLTNNEIATLFIKEYDAMKTELRDYIKRYYSSIVIVESIIFATIFTAAKEKLPWLYLFVPGLMMGFAALMSLITLFISQQSSYVKLLEQRLNKLCGKDFFIWETQYADYALRRDKGIRFSFLISFIYISLVIPLVPAFAASLYKGYQYLKINHVGWETGFLVFSVISALSFALFPITNKLVRNQCSRFNKELIANNHKHAK